MDNPSEPNTQPQNLNTPVMKHDTKGIYPTGDPEAKPATISTASFDPQSPDAGQTAPPAPQQPKAENFYQTASSAPSVLPAPEAAASPMDNIYPSMSATSQALVSANEAGSISGVTSSDSGLLPTVLGVLSIIVFAVALFTAKSFWLFVGINTVVSGLTAYFSTASFSKRDYPNIAGLFGFIASMWVLITIIIIVTIKIYLTIRYRSLINAYGF